MYQSMEVESGPGKWDSQRKGRSIGLVFAVVVLALLGLAAVSSQKFGGTSNVSRERHEELVSNLELQRDEESGSPVLVNEKEDLSEPEVAETDLPETEEEKAEGKKLEDMSEQEEFVDVPKDVGADHRRRRNTCAKLVGGTSKAIVYGGNHRMWKGKGSRSHSVWIGYGRWHLRGKARAIAFLSGFDIGTGPNTRIRIGARAVRLRKSLVTVTTWADSRVWASKFGFLATTFPRRQFAMTTVNTYAQPRVIQWKGTQTRSRIVVLPCRGQAKVFAALTLLDVTHTRHINTRLRMTAFSKKLRGNKVRVGVRFNTWANSKIYSAGAAIAAWCPTGYLGRRVSTGSVKFMGGHANRMWNGNGLDEETKYVRFRRRMPCARPQVSIGLTAIDFGRNKNYRLFVSPKNVNRFGFNVVFKTWSNTQLWWAQVSFVAICPK